VIRAIGRYAGLLFALGTSASCGLVIGLAIASRPAP
jgi:hypothetical protein